jgi:hypothetical protein
MQYIFMAILSIALVSAVISFFVMGWKDTARSRRLAREANQRQIRFDREDPLGTPARFRDFLLISGGHAPRTRNVAHGRLGEYPVRAFDFRFEVGHGTRRQTRRYSVIVFDLEQSYPDVVLWHDLDRHAAPPPVRKFSGRIAQWSYSGSRLLADTINNAAGSLAEDGLGVEVRDGHLMLWLPSRGRVLQDYCLWMDQALMIRMALQQRAALLGDSISTQAT